MHDAASVHVRERARELRQHRAHLHLGQPLGRCALPVEQLGQVAARTVVHSDAQLLVGHEGVDEAHDVRVVERAQYVDLVERQLTVLGRRDHDRLESEQQAVGAPAHEEDAAHGTTAEHLLALVCVDARRGVSGAGIGAMGRHLRR